MENEDLLEHMEQTHEEYLDLVDKIPTEDKIYLSREEIHNGLEPWEISELAQEVIAQLPESMRTDDTDALFNLVYETINEALDRARS
jgi:hypothetical protein